MAEDEMSDTEQDDRRGQGRREDELRSRPDRDGPIPILEELFRGEDEASEGGRRGTG